MANRLDPDEFIFSDGRTGRSYFKFKSDGGVSMEFVYKKWCIAHVFERSHGVILVGKVSKGWARRCVGV